MAEDGRKALIGASGRNRMVEMRSGLVSAARARDPQGHAKIQLSIDSAGAIIPPCHASASSSGRSATAPGSVSGCRWLGRLTGF